jgi:MYXO-CTERM domain-containing protein
MVASMPALTLASGWARLEPAADPGARNGFAMAHDGERVVLMGGRTLEGGAQGDLWTLEGQTWQQVGGGGGQPGPRWNHTLVFDGQNTLLFGGEEDSTGIRQVLDDAWVWQDSWSRADEDGPPARARHAVAYDWVRNRVVLCGGATAGDTAGDTWEWDPSSESWTERSVSGPDPRRDHAMAFDGSRVILFGGLADGYLGDTWAYDGNAWVREGDGPSPRSGHAMAGGDGLVVAFGGQGPDTIYGDTWIWNGSWTRVATEDEGPGRRFGHAMVWAEDHAVLFGGNTPALNAETWVYTPDAIPDPTDGGNSGDATTTDGDTDAATETGPDAEGEGGGCGCRVEGQGERRLGGLLFMVALFVGSRRRNKIGGTPCAS